MINIIKNIDLFSQPFSFFIGEHNKKKNTIAGGFLSVSIILIALGYFAYLLTLYFDNRMLPKITTTNLNQQSYYNMTFSKSAFGFTYYAQGQTLDELEKSTGKKYLTFKILYSTYLNASLTSFSLPIADCLDDSNFTGYKCIDFSASPDVGKTLFQDPSTLSMSFYQLVVSPCTGLANCASPQEISNTIIDNNFIFFIKIRITQYNESTKQFEEGYSVDFLQFDDQLAMTGVYYFQRSSYTINTGMFVQNTSITNTVSAFRKTIQYNSQTNLLQKVGYSGYASFQFNLDQTINVSKVQFPMVTEILASFVSIFNILLILGVVVKKFAESKIIEDVNNIYLKEYYKNTAINYLERDSKMDINEANQNPSKVQEIQKLKQKIDQLDISFKQKKKFTQSFCQFMKQLICGFYLKYKKDAQKEQGIYKEMIQLTSKRLNIYAFYKELIKLKLAVRLMLSKDQYAALQYCGCTLNLKNDYYPKIPIIIEDQKVEQKTQNPIGQSQVPPNLRNPLSQSNSSQYSNNEVVINKVKSISIQIKQEMEKFSPQKVILLEEKENKQQQEQSNQNQNTHIQIAQEMKHSLKLQKEDIICEQLEGPFTNETPSLQNHLQELEEIDNNDELLKENFWNFIDRFDRNKSISQIDRNIYASLIRCKTQDQ